LRQGVRRRRVSVLRLHCCDHCVST
jgi:hypothetical protein